MDVGGMGDLHLRGSDGWAGGRGEGERQGGAQGEGAVVHAESPRESVPDRADRPAPSEAGARDAPMTAV